MAIKRFIALALASLLSASVLASCSQQGTMDKPFVKEDEVKREYSSAVEGSALTLYVDGKVETSGDGSEASPFKTIPEAQAKIRELKAGEGLPVGGITVFVKDGEYQLTEGLEFTAEDSGTEECPITYVSESEFGAVVSGGLILSASDFEPISEEEKEKLLDDTAKEKVVKVDLQKKGLTSDIISTVGGNAMELFINGERSTLARYPNDGFVKTYIVIDTGDTHQVFTSIDFNNSKDGFYTIEGFDYSVNNRGGVFKVYDDVFERVSKWSSYNDIYAHGYFKFSWRDSTTRFGNIDVDTGEFTLANAVTYGISKGAPFYFLNVYDEIDSQGEFFIDKEKGILYVYKTEGFEDAEIMISSLQKPIITASDISYVNFKGFSFCATRSNGLNISGNYITVDNCKIFNIRNSAIVANGNNITVQNSECYNLGSYGIILSGGDATTLTPSNNLVYNNYIHDFSVIQRTYTPAIDLSGCGSTVSHNEICNAPHMAVRWSGPNHVMEYNEVYNVCMETSDCSAFYAGRNLVSYGCVIRYNYIHDVGQGDVFAHAIYWDDGLSGQTAYGNICVNTASTAIVGCGGRDNVIENNLIINSAKHPISYDNRTRDEMLDPVECWFTHAEEMANAMVATRNDAWIAAFPTYEEIIPWYEGYEGDLDDPKLSGNPANVIIKNNISYTGSDHTGGPSLEIRSNGIADDIFKFSLVSNNPVYVNDHSDIPAWQNETFTFIENAKGLEACPDFKLLPFEEMGRID